MGRPPGSRNNGAKKSAAKGSRKAAAASAAPVPREAPRKEAAKPNRPSPEKNADWLARLTRLKTEARVVAGNISALGSEIKGAAGETHWKSLKALHDLMKLDPDEARERLESLVEVAAQQEIRITWAGSQATFADVMEQAQPPAKNTQGSRDLAAAKAHSDGFNSGRHGGAPHDNPFSHAPGSEEYVSWLHGRDEGQQAREAKRPGETARVREAATADATLPGETPAEAPIF